MHSPGLLITIMLLALMTPFALIVGICIWSAFRKNPLYILERQECRVAQADAQAHAFTLPVRLLDGQRRYAFLAVAADGAVLPRTVPLQFTSLRKTEAAPALLRLTTMKKSGKTEAPEQDYLVRETYVLAVPPDVVVQDFTELREPQAKVAEAVC